MNNETADTVELHIDQLVLHGGAPAERARIGAALRAELARLMADAGLPPALRGGGRIERLEGVAYRAAPGASAEATGRQIARAIYMRIRQ